MRPTPPARRSTSCSARACGPSCARTASMSSSACAGRDAHARLSHDREARRARARSIPRRSSQRTLAALGRSARRGAREASTSSRAFVLGRVAVAARRDPRDGAQHGGSRRTVILGFFAAVDRSTAPSSRCTSPCPPAEVDGYVRDDRGRPLRYRLNGLRRPRGRRSRSPWRSSPSTRLPWRRTCGDTAGPSSPARASLGLLFTAALVLPGARRPGGRCSPTSTSGAAENPHWRGGTVDAKMWLYLARRGDAGAQRSVVRRAPGLAFAGGPVALASCSTPRCWPLRRRLPHLRDGPPLHLRLVRRARRLQARLGLPGLLPVLLLRGPLGTRRPARPARARLAARPRRALVLRRGWTLVARREHAEVPLQARSHGPRLRPARADRR